MQEAKLTQEEKEQVFKEACVFTVQTAKALATFCKTIEEFIEMVETAGVNDGQLRLLMSLIGKK